MKFLLTQIFCMICPSCCLLITACQQLPYDQAEYEKQLQKREARISLFTEHLKEAHSARVEAVTMVGKHQKKRFRMSAEEFERVRKMLAHTQAVSPAMGENDNAHACFYGGITLEFLNAEGKVIEQIYSPQWQYMPESTARRLSPMRPYNCYEALWSLPDAECAEWKSLPVLKEANDWLDQVTL